MKTIESKSRTILRGIFKGISLTAVAFIFQACYGPGGDMCNDVKFTGTVKSKTSNMPIKGIKVSVNDNMGITDEKGNFNFYASICYDDYDNNDQVKVHFDDIDGVENGHFDDTTITVKPKNQNEVRINVELKEKQ